MRRLTRVTAAVLVAGTALGMGGCNPASSRVTLSVYFKSGTTSAQLQHAQQACTGVAPNTQPEPLPAASGSAAQLAGNQDEIRFLVSHANDHDLAQLTNCLSKQPGVSGVQQNDGTDG